MGEKRNKSKTIQEQLQERLLKKIKEIWRFKVFGYRRTEEERLVYQERLASFKV